MNPVDEIQNILKSLNSNQKNKTGNLYLNQIGNEFITFKEKIEIPRIPVKELDYKLSVGILHGLIKNIPEFLNEHTLLKKRKPASEQQALHFINYHMGKHLHFIHIFRIDFKFSGDSGNIIEQGNSDFYPSFITDRIYYKSRIVPEIGILKHEGSIVDFNPIRLKTSSNLESDLHKHTFAIFDELNTGEISHEFCNQIDPKIFNISSKLYPFISFDYFTATLNVLYPTSEEIKKAIIIFEPLFFVLYSNYFDYKNLIENDDLDKKFNFEIKIENNRLKLKEDFIEKIKEYFNRFSLFRDDKLILKGWRVFEID